MTISVPQVLAVIPARRASSRLPEKPLKLIGGKTLLERVHSVAKHSKRVTRLVIATDDKQIFDLAKSFSAEVVMTSPECETGTERVAEVARSLGATKWDAVVNIQGDMPFLHPRLIDGTIDLLFQTSAKNGFDMTTLATPIFDEAAFHSSSTVKVVVGEGGQGLYFSRAPIPHSRDGVRPQIRGSAVLAFKHIGLYVFKPQVLEFFNGSGPSMLERVEMLEQLRALEAGYKIGVHLADPELTRLSIEIDTPEDLARAQEIAQEFDEKFLTF